MVNLHSWERDAPIGGRPALEGQVASNTIPLEPERNDWDRALGESGKAYAAFLAYRDLGLERTLTKAAEKVTKRKQTLHRWSMRWNWRERAISFDRFMEEQEMRATIKKRVEFRELSLTIAQNLTTKAALAVQALKTTRESSDGKQYMAIKPGELIQILELAHKMQLELLGKADDDQVAKIEVFFGVAPGMVPPPPSTADVEQESEGA